MVVVVGFVGGWGGVGRVVLLLVVVCVPNRISKPHTTEHATTLRARASGSNGPSLIILIVERLRLDASCPAGPPGGPHHL